MKTPITTMLVTATLLGSTAVFAQATVDTSLPVYQKTSGVSGNLSSVGSDTLANLMTLWAESFKKTYPNVNVQIQAAGSCGRKNRVDLGNGKTFNRVVLMYKNGQSINRDSHGCRFVAKFLFKGFNFLIFHQAAHRPEI